MVECWCSGAAAYSYRPADGGWARNHTAAHALAESTYPKTVRRPSKGSIDHRKVGANCTDGQEKSVQPLPRLGMEEVYRAIGLAQSDAVAPLGRCAIGGSDHHGHRVAVEISDRVVDQRRVHIGLTTEFLEKSDVGVDTGIPVIGQCKVLRTDTDGH